MGLTARFAQTLSQLDAAWLIHSRPYRETSSLAWFFCLEQGRVNALAKGWRNRKPKDRALLQPFVPLLVRFGGKGDLKNLLHLEATSPPKALSGKASVCGLYANELLARLMPEGQPSAALFKSYSLLLELLNQPDQLEPALRNFEFSLLAYLDQPFVYRDTEGELLEVDAYYTWQPTLGFSLAKQQITEQLAENAASYQPEASPLTAQSLNTSREPMFHGARLLDIQADTWHHPETRKTAKLLTRLALHYHLGNKPLETRKLMQMLMTTQATAKQFLAASTAEQSTSHLTSTGI